MTTREKICLEISDKLEKITADLNKMSIEVDKENPNLGFRLSLKVMALQEISDKFFMLEN